MDYLKYTVLTNADKHLRVENNKCYDKEKVRKLYSCIENVITSSETARKEGLLALEEFAYGLKCEEGSVNEFIKNILLLIVDGTDPEFVRNINEGLITVDGADSLNGYMKLIAMEGLLMVQAGCNPRIIEEALLGMVPSALHYDIKNRLSEHNEEFADSYKDVLTSKWTAAHVKVSNNPFMDVFCNKVRAMRDRDVKTFAAHVQPKELGHVLLFADYDVKERVTALIPKAATAVMGDWVDYYYEEGIMESLFSVAQKMQKLEDCGDILSSCRNSESSTDTPSIMDGLLSPEDIQELLKEDN